jgi:choline monooxygenase
MHAPHDPLNPAHFERVRQPAMEAETLPPWCYTSKEWFDLEVERILRPNWNYIGHTNRVPKPGDYLAFDYLGAPIIIMRGRDNQVRAFANTCRHRGVELLTKGQGTCKGAIKCPYHGWVYGLDGKLTGAAGMEKTESFDKAEHGLVPVRLELLGQFMFINFSKDAPSLKTFLGDLWENVQAYDPDNLVVTRRKEYELACNWKIIADNFNDESHIRTVHKTSLLDITEKYTKPAFYETGGGPYVSSFCEHTGTRTLIGGVDGPAGFPPIPTLTGRYKHGSYHPTIFPHACFGLCIDGGWALEIHPLAVNRAKVVVNVFFHKDAVARPDFEQLAGRYYKRFEVSTEEDNHIQEGLQRGYNSPDARPGRLGIEEIGINWLQNWWLDQMIGPSPAREKKIHAYAA